MLSTINDRFNAKKADAKAHEFIVESVMDVEEVLPGSEEELDDEVDVDSVPTDVYNKIDKALEDAINSGEYDDTEVEELVDDEDEVEGVSDADIEAIVNEAVDYWDGEEHETHGADAAETAEDQSSGEDVSDEVSVIDESFFDEFEFEDL